MSCSSEERFFGARVFREREDRFRFAARSDTPFIPAGNIVQETRACNLKRQIGSMAERFGR